MAEAGARGGRSRECSSAESEVRYIVKLHYNIRGEIIYRLEQTDWGNAAIIYSETMKARLSNAPSSVWSGSYVYGSLFTVDGFIFASCPILVFRMLGGTRVNEIMCAVWRSRTRIETNFSKINTPE